jgi:hypothetical protein
MRSLVITAVIVMGSYRAASAGPSWPVIEAGWCPDLVYHQVVGSRANVDTTYYDATLAPTTAPKPRGHEWSSFGFVSTNGWYTRVKASVVGKTIEITNEVHRCEDTGAGCIPGRAESWGGEVVATINVPTDTCIEYRTQLAGGLVIGTSHGTWVIPEGGKVKKIRAPRLQMVKALETVAFAQDGSSLRAIRWPVGAKAPTFDVLPAIISRTVAIHPINGTAYVFTEQAVVVLDVDTLAEQWQLAGRYHSLLMPEGATEWAFVRIEKDQVILDVRRVAGKEPQEVVRSRVVYDGPSIDAEVTLLGTTYQIAVAR